ncbi:hypothetical protein A3F00_04180 [Candidatus Daviesbacteria bacterium RIFCSPHIGHO2_12_FULL_37_11]|uniref:Bacterial Ig domain-containing protein n=1 Tax=Candidatus Daviesbacteria bacterium RIFCSPHIGHO2_12_FULL_37_11 TaxID=1797777 RepID=A0A1F5KEH2_9BACT|nr:MAG: hypothetical protein A2769_02665 [Candidatus Daviesbacteria bacterium RIFCSPHIGHO2_01_FULL_37_27]OGE39254.1 MAG: hypothetical protein A3F00_04180 [Candidatus Daviesbacteria bacterium RIFCSPHIGHO2_12_FULL_37_11]OGE45628.1 MAG: hypothetical protein A3B39_00540 [Candidatus Daviesbacteria bacterium RIFCSPLOWO2_01_FULL_37_10]
MSYRTRSTRRFVKKSRTNFLTTIIISALLIYVTFFWILPNLINGLGNIKNFINPNQKKGQDVSENPSFAPPVLNIPYEATNSSVIEISGFTSPNSRVKIYVDDSLESTTQSDENGSFTAKNVNLNLGTNNIYGKSVDDKDKESLPSKTIRLMFDNEEPILEVSEPEDGHAFQSERKIKVSGKTEAGVKVFVNDAQAIVASDGSFNLIFNLNDGENILTIKAVDLASNFEEITKKVTFQP